MRLIAKLLLAGVLLSVVIGCGEKEEPNPQVTQNPTKEQLDKAAASGGDVQRPPASQSSDQ